MSRAQEIVVLVLMVASFAFGYLTKSSSISKVEVQDQTAKVADKHSVVTIVTHKEKNGDVEVMKTTDSVIKTKTKEQKQVQIQPKSSPLNVSLMGGYNFSDLHHLTPIYGISATKQVFGPLTAGVYGMTNGIVGLTIGVNF